MTHRTASDERAAIVAWLRRKGYERCPLGLFLGDAPSVMFDLVTDAIERLDHHKEEDNA